MENRDSIKKNLYVANIWMDHAPHMDAERRDIILEGYPEEERKARRYGIPERGSGRVFTKKIDDIVVPWFKIPEEWDVAAGLDVGNSNEHATSCIAVDRDWETQYHQSS